ncbi:CheR family methyltransferase [Thermomonas fusca]|uniref:CheR family methyltransferase n=1 Tax=Thermomonas fusca TaxID=215690 RepID=UPI00048A4E92|nr:CheR family methyltransferase [Thermomonas fusca]
MPGVVFAAVNEEALFDLEVRLLLEALFQRYHHDFRDYALASVRRRVRQAMQRLECESVADLQNLVLHEPDAFAQALPFFTVQVSEMFRDPAYFLALREHVAPVLRTYPSLKIWVAGCSNGEEVWSLAILLAEEGLLERTLIYATDINPQALRAAESATYEARRVGGFSKNYQAAGGTGSLSDYYSSAYGRAVFDRHLRKHVVFADHSLATDAVFSEVHLVSCRNVLIYFNAGLQDRAIGLFREALVHRGFLGLGSRESLRSGANANAFEPLVAAQKLFRKKA